MNLKLYICNAVLSEFVYFKIPVPTFEEGKIQYSFNYGGFKYRTPESNTICVLFPHPQT